MTALSHDATRPKQISEIETLSCFLKAVSGKKSQLVGFHSSKADIKILLQRAVARGFESEKFVNRPVKTWLWYDNFTSHNSVVDVELIEILGGAGSSNP